MPTVKIQLQSESSECGLAALAMVMNHHGLGADLGTLRRRFCTSLKGASLARLMQIAGQSGFRARPLRIDLEHLRQLETPCILHWDLDHFVVLARARRRGVTILDPARGKRRLDYREVSNHFTGVALELSPGKRLQPQARPTAVSLRALTGRISGLWRGLGLVFGLSLALQVFVLVGPFFLQWTVDQVLLSADRDLLTVLALGFGLVLLLQVGVTLLRGWAVVFLSTRLGMQWTGNVFAHLLRLPLDFFGKRHLGDVVSRMGSVQAIQNTLTTSFVEALIDGLMAVVTFAMLITYSWKLALVSLAAVCLYLAIRALVFSPVREGTNQQLVAAARQQSHLLESIRGMQSVKTSGIEQEREARYLNLMNETVNRDIRLAKLTLGFSSASGLIFGIERIVVIWIGALLALANTFSVGMLIAYLAYKDQFASRIAALIDKWIEFRMLRLHGERLADIVLTAPEEAPRNSFESGSPATSRIDVRGLWFRFAEGDPWILKQCSFTIAEGESVAVVGPSGCGKTTLIRLLACLLQPVEGEIRVGGQNIGYPGSAVYRRMIGAVMQDDQLFAGSVADNIALGGGEFDLMRIEAAARLAAVHDEIQVMPMGYHSLIGDMGTTLSGGQKQRIILARALYRRPRILFLDEATSHLDVEREQLVNEAVRRLQLTRVIVAHRPQTVASADRVFVLRYGTITEEIASRDSCRGFDAGAASATACAGR